MREKEKLTLWEVAMALIAIGGISNLLDWMPKFAIASMLGIALIIILIIGTTRFLAARFPIKVDSARVNINTVDARRLLKENKQGYPMIEVELIFFSTDEVRVSKRAILKFDKKIENELRKIGRLRTEFDLQIRDRENTKPFFVLNAGEAIEAGSAMPLQMIVPFTEEIDAKLEDIYSKLEGNFVIGWQELGHKISWHKPVRGRYEL